MKKITYSVLALFLLFNACSNDLNLVAPYKRIPVVYGFLTLSDTAQFIKVEKAFIDPAKSAVELAQNPDSIYFSNIEVSLQQENTGKTWLLDRVDGNTQGYPKDGGIFVNSPNYLYKIKTKDITLNAGEKYKLIIKDANTKALIGEAITNVVGNYSMVNTDPPNPAAWPYKSDIRFSWRSTETAGRVYDVMLRFNYQENSEAQPTKFVKKSIDWKIADNVVRPADLTSRITTTVKGEEFFKFFALNLVENPFIKRIFVSYDIQVVAGGEEFKDYIDLGNASGGITSSQILPTYSNISNDGIGIFSSRNVLWTKDYSINTTTRDSLKNGIYTNKLGFQ